MATRLKFENVISIKNNKISKNTSYGVHESQDDFVGSIKPVMNSWIRDKIDLDDGSVTVRTICTETIKGLSIDFKITNVIQQTKQVTE